jgi:L-alanine-DL-glutamate epimerase-like enolase superfamily enzyme
MINITAIQELPVRLQGNITNAVVDFSQHDVSLVAVTANRDGELTTGFGFNSIGRFAQSGILKSRIIPRILAARPETLLSPDQQTLDPGALVSVAMQNEKPGGHGDRAGAVAALELAIWDLNAKLANEPAYLTIARAAGKTVSDPAVLTYAAGGYYYDGDYQGLEHELTHYKRLGFERCKIKIGGTTLSEDLARFEVAANVMGASSLVAVDANGRFDQTIAMDYLRALEKQPPAWLEEPVDPLAYFAMHNLIAATDIPIATGENLFSFADSANLLQFAGMRKGKDLFQMDAGLSYGLTEYMKIIELLIQWGHNLNQLIPHGGHLVNLHIVAGLGLGGCEAYPGVFQPFGGFSPACEMIRGRVRPSSAPGFGLEEKPELVPFLKQVLAS